MLIDDWPAGDHCCLNSRNSFQRQSRLLLLLLHLSNSSSLSAHHPCAKVLILISQDLTIDYSFFPFLTHPPLSTTTHHRDRITPSLLRGLDRQTVLGLRRPSLPVAKGLALSSVVLASWRLSSVSGQGRRGDPAGAFHLNDRMHASPSPLNIPFPHPSSSSGKGPPL